MPTLVDDPSDEGSRVDDDQSLQPHGAGGQTHPGECVGEITSGVGDHQQRPHRSGVGDPNWGMKGGAELLRTAM